ncbi:MAG: hypothetical protein VX672_00790 [Planctomycetota bacterium]|nr:hypothetical protein [Planctomycetota bacterium]
MVAAATVDVENVGEVAEVATDPQIDVPAALAEGDDRIDDRADAADVVEGDEDVGEGDPLAVVAAGDQWIEPNAAGAGRGPSAWAKPSRLPATPSTVRVPPTESGTPRRTSSQLGGAARSMEARKERAVVRSMTLLESGWAGHRRVLEGHLFPKNESRSPGFDVRFDFESTLGDARAAILAEGLAAESLFFVRCADLFAISHRSRGLQGDIER